MLLKSQTLQATPVPTSFTLTQKEKKKRRKRKEKKYDKVYNQHPSHECSFTT